MSQNLQSIIDKKRALRRNLASRPLPEKLRTLDVLREREIAIRSAARSSYRSAVQERSTWTWVELREIAKIVTGSTPPKARQEFYGGTFPFVKPGELLDCPLNDSIDRLSDEGSKVADIAPTGAILVSCIGNLGKTGFATRPLAFNQQINAIIPHVEEDTKWIFYAVQTSNFRSQLAVESSATTIAIVNKAKFSRLRIPLAPDGEQRRIVSEIEKQFTRLEAGVSALKRAHANLKSYRAAVLKAACEGRLVPTEAALRRATANDGKRAQIYETGAQLLARIHARRGQSSRAPSKFKQTAAPDTADLPQLPEGWAWAVLDSLADIKGGITKDQNRKHDSSVRSVPYLRVANVQRGYLDLREMKTITASEDEIRELALKQGDVLFNEGGDRDKLGRGWVWNGELRECIHQNHVFRARLLDTSLNPKFLSWYANTFGQKFFFDEGKHTTNLASISMTKLKNLPLPIPPAAEQMRIVAEVDRRLSVVEELETVVSASLQRAARLRQSILQRAFSGNL
jgi:type I restriction enzyme, S subunit